MEDGPRELFGGAMSVRLGREFMDVSSFRQVPDNQEVFVHHTNQSLIVEILELASDHSGESIGRFHFDAYMHDCEPISSRVLRVNQIVPDQIITSTTAPVDHSLLVRDARCEAWLVVGRMAANKFKESAPERAKEVDVYLAVFRVNAVASDILMVLNDPAASNGRTTGDTLGEASAVDAFVSIATSLQIRDWALFGDAP
mmetsp:Transcript_1951/g.4279  ORF Transcript_1951/g.4279 Transcript_1951/m.4279 type:complete len:199 (-) Transcript_1951:88-684(-)